MKPFVRRVRRRNEQHFVQARTAADASLRDANMGVVNRIERAAEKGDSHFRILISILRK